MRFKDRYPAIKLPELDVVGVNQLLSAFFCCLLVGAVKIGRAYNAATFIQKVSPVVQHPQSPARKQ